MDTLRRGQQGTPMPFAVEVVEEDRLVRARLYGDSNIEEARAAVAAIKSRVGLHPVEGVLLDVRDLHYAPTPDEARDIGAELVNFLARRRLAIVTRLLVHYKMARTIVLRAKPRGVDVDVFADEDGALDWLHSPDTEERDESLPHPPGESPSPHQPNQNVAGTTGRKKD